MNMDIGDRVRWVPEKQADWAGDHVGQIVAIDKERPGFEGLPPQVMRRGDERIEIPQRGPAVAIKLDHKGHVVWAPPEEVMALLP